MNKLKYRVNVLYRLKCVIKIRIKKRSITLFVLTYIGIV